ncbi:MAG: hypothetical protein J6O54_00245 [Prevotella sp.]|jgi:hypothetical protein|nr:hypothetical protein [Prevotella sp.]
MPSPLAIIPLMLHATRPSRTADMPAIALPFWIRKGYDGLTFFGHIITHSQEEARQLNERYDDLKNHEMIHLYQARSTHDSWLCFYWLYFVYWLRALPFRKRLRNSGYWLNPFEMEAYDRMDDLKYLDDKESGTNEWRRYAKMSVKERYNVYLARKRSA